MPEANAGQLVLRCQSCEARVKVPASAAGKKAKCPRCGAAFRIPSTGVGEPTPKSASLEGPTTDPVRFNCDNCGAKIKVPSSAVGRRVKCPKCAALLTVPAPEPAVAEPREDELGFADDGDDLLGDLAAAERSAEALAQPDLAATAPPAAPPMPRPPAGGGVAAGTAGAAGAALGSLTSFAGPFVLGCVFSAVGAAIGGAIWFGVAMATEYEIGWIAWGLGGMAGFGMHVGYRKSNGMAGVIAAGVSVAAILLAKVAIFHFVTQPLFDSFSDEGVGVEAVRSRVIEAVTDEILEQRGYSWDDDMDEEAFDAAWEEAEREATVQVRAMSDEQLRARDIELMRETVVIPIADEILEERGITYEDDPEAYQAAQEDAKEEARKRVEAMSDEEVRERWQTMREEVAQAFTDAVRGSFFEVMFGWMDLLFVGLAVVTAFKLGAQGVSFSNE